MRIAVFESTPNPNALKCVLAEPQIDGVRSYRAREEAEGDPLGEALFGIDGVVGVLIHTEFVTLSKSATAKWGPIRRAAARTIESSRT